MLFVCGDFSSSRCASVSIRRAALTVRQINAGARYGTKCCGPHPTSLPTRQPSDRQSGSQAVCRSDLCGSDSQTVRLSVGQTCVGQAVRPSKPAIGRPSPLIIVLRLGLRLGVCSLCGCYRECSWVQHSTPQLQGVRCGAVQLTAAKRLMTAAVYSTNHLSGAALVPVLLL